MNSRIRFDRSDAAGIAPQTPYSLSEKINVCRGLFAFLVVSSHAWTMAHLIDRQWSTAPSFLRGAIDSVAGEGLYYMMGFFVVSGYCIQVSARRLTSGGRFPLKTYMIARLTRILPLYYAALLFAVVVESLVGAHRPPLWRSDVTGAAVLDQTLLIQGFTRTFGSFSASWSITNECVYYLLFGLLAAATAAAKSRVRPSVVGLLVTIGLAAGCQILIRTSLNSPVVIRASMLFGLGTIWFLGAIVADYAPRLPLAPIARRASACWPLILVLAMVMWYGQWGQQRNVYLTSGFAFTLMLIRFIVQEHDAGPAPKRRPRPYTEALGLASYPTYLFHGPILQGLGATFDAAGVKAAWWLYWPLATLLSVGCGWGVGLLIERPIIAWRAGVLKRLNSTPAREPGSIAVPALGVPQ
ncbi:MAG: acyltransferase [Paludisphaera borealis]|uniref:acyltransferase family protein n=1 Tax=Paludisphaera borealis TaxID=1387353 RepID=UPI002847C928|nr:acyltransferase [Paludisphaera borealis]MDR3620376.1 acyltransferase [Paludisphaera borealis]